MVTDDACEKARAMMRDIDRLRYELAKLTEQHFPRGTLFEARGTRWRVSMVRDDGSVCARGAEFNRVESFEPYELFPAHAEPRTGPVAPAG
jgi:hypothetical protein